MVNTIRSILIALALLIALETQSFALNNADEYLELYSKCCRNGLVYSNQDCDSQVQRFYWDNMPPEQRSRPIMSGKVPRGLNFLLMPPERELSDLCANPSKYLSDPGYHAG